MFKTRARRMLAAITLTGAAIGATLGATQTAAAYSSGRAPNPHDASWISLTVYCDNGIGVEAISNSNGQFSPAHVEAGWYANSNLIPLSFGPIRYTVYDDSNNFSVVEDVVFPADDKGNSVNAVGGATVTTCSFSGGRYVQSSNIEYYLSGTVVAKITKSQTQLPWPPKN